MADLAATLLACQNPDPNIRNGAEQSLIAAEKNNLPEFFIALATELATEEREPAVRQLAGLHLKNLLTAKDEEMYQAKMGSWKAVPSASRSQTKSILLKALTSNLAIARHTAAQAAAEVAAIELPFNEWPEFLPASSQHVASPNTPDGVKISTLECLGYTSERLALVENVNENTVDQMLTAIVEGINPNKVPDVRLAAATALRNSLIFTKKNMEQETERNMIMATICDATQCTEDARVRAAAFECIVEIANNYYDKLASYMQTLFQLTFNAIKTDEEAVARQAIEFWCALCEEEMDLQMEEEEARDLQTPIARASVHYVEAALTHLVPLLLETMTKQDEDEDEDRWNISMAAANCLCLVSNTVGDAVVAVVVPFVQQSILDENNWRLREAATTAFCMILEGPTQACIGPVVNQSIPVLLNALNDQHTMVKDATAYTLGKICELHACAIPTEGFQPLVTGLVSTLTQHARVATQGAFALRNLAAAFDKDTSSSTTNALSSFMPTLLQSLLQAADRSDSDEYNLRVCAFEAISMLIQQSAPDCRPLLLQFLPAILQRLSQSFSLSDLTNEDRDAKEGMQSLLCSIIQVLTMKVTKEDVGPFSDSIMQSILQVLQAKHAVAHEEAFLAAGALADLLEADFDKYVSTLHPYLINGIQNSDAYQVCAVAVGLIGDICRAIEGRIQPYCDTIMSALLQSLQNQALHRSVKPPLVSAFSDIALAIGAAFEPYLQHSLMMMMQASQTRAPDDDDDFIEYVNQLREGILEAYTGITQGLADGNKINLLLPYAEPIFQLMELISNEGHYDMAVLSKSIGLIGDLASCAGPDVARYLNQPYIHSLLQAGRTSYNENTQSTTAWATENVQKALSVTSTAP